MTSKDKENGNLKHVRFGYQFKLLSPESIYACVDLIFYWNLQNSGLSIQFESTGTSRTTYFNVVISFWKRPS